MITTTKYEEHGFADIISGLVKIYSPKVVVELGTQQGASAILIAKAMKDGHVYTFDSFSSTYEKPPYAETHASIEETIENIKNENLSDKISVMQMDAFKVAREFKSVDMLHIDLCNYYHNIKRLLPQWLKKVHKIIVMEGGGVNKWQRENGFLPFYPLLNAPEITNFYNKLILKKDADYALTVLIRKGILHDSNV